MLKDHLYELENLVNNEGLIDASIKLNPQHQIFNGHYPGQPVLPGACMLQIIKEILQISLNYELKFSTIRQLKFLKMVDPNTEPVLQIRLNYRKTENGLSLDAIIKAGEAICFKMTGMVGLLVSTLN